MKTKEVDMLKEVLAAWPGEIEELEMLFKERKLHVF